MFRPTLEAQNGSGGSRDAKHHQYASDEIHCTTSVGLTRIELVTSSFQHSAHTRAVKDTGILRPSHVPITALADSHLWLCR